MTFGGTAAGKPARRAASKYAGRFALPLVLLVASLVTWLVADRLGGADREATTATETADLAAPLVSVRRLPEVVASAGNATAIEEALASLPPDPEGLSCAMVLIDGVPALEIRVDQTFVPSHAQLLLTGHAAIEILGPDYRYETRVMAAARPDDDGVAFGSLFLIGGGDPVLRSAAFARSFRPVLTTRTRIEDLASAIVDTGITQLSSGLIVVEDRYDRQRSLPGWPPEFVTTGQIGPLSALQVDGGFEFRGAGGEASVGAGEPARLAGLRLVEELEDADVRFFGSVEVLAEDEQLPELVPLAFIESPPLSEIVSQMLAGNDVQAAELILKELGVANNGIGSTQAGARAVHDVLRTAAGAFEVPFRDGSGLDPFGGVSCRHLAEGTDAIAQDHPTLELLPTPQQPGVFDDRMRTSELLSDMRLVGGTTGEATGIVGRTVDQGRRVTIAAISNRDGGASELDIAFQQALVEMVDEVRSSITVEAIGVEENE